MKNHLAKSIRNSVKHWYLPLLAGIIFLMMGVFSFTSPLATYLTLSALFSISFISAGIIDTVFAIQNRDQMDGWGWQLAYGILTIMMGVALFTRPGLSMVTFSFYIGFTVLFRSFAAVALSLELKNYGERAWGNLMAIGVLGVIFGFILIWNPGFAGMTIVTWAGIGFILTAIFSIYSSFQMRKLHKNWDSVTEQAKEKFEKARQEFIDEVNR